MTITAASWEAMVARRVRRIRVATTAGVVALAVGGFAMSYGSLHGLALEEGVPPSLAWMWPLIVDGFIVVASLSVLHAVLERRRSAYPWCLVLLFSAISVGFNVLHAQPTPVARLVGAVPPLALVLSFELLMRQVRASLEPQMVAGARQAEATPAPKIAAEGDGSPAPSRPRRQPVMPAQALAAIAQHEAAGRRVTGATLARELGVSDSYGRRLLRLHAEGKVTSGSSVEAAAT